MTNATWTPEDWNGYFQERAAILEFDQGMTRAEAEAQAVREIYDIRIKQRMPGIMGELAAADQRRRDQRISAEVEATFGPVGFSWGFGWVVAEGDGYRPAIPDEPASTAFIAPVVADGCIVDLVAQTFRLQGIRSRLGITSLVGSDDVDAARSDGRPLYVYSSLPQWLQGGGHGAVVVDWKRAGYELDGVAEILCSASIAARLHDATRQCVPAPVIATPAKNEVGNAA